LDDIATYYHLYRDLMAFWYERYHDHILDIIYEDFVDQPDQNRITIFEHLGLSAPSSQKQWKFDQSSVVRTASRHQVNQPIYKNSSSEWKKISDCILPQLSSIMALENE
jgi:hypothetical protein